MKAQEANQFENVHLICTISSSRITFYYIDLDRARKSKHDTKRTMALCSEIREGLEMYPEMVLRSRQVLDTRDRTVSFVRI